MEKLRSYFEGRLNRRQFILRYLLTMVIGFVVIFALIFGLAIVAAVQDGDQNSAQAMIDMLTIPLALIISLIGLSFEVRRFHDLNKGGKWLLLPVGIVVLGMLPMFRSGVPSYILGLISIIMCLYLCFTPGTEGPNDYGEPRQ